mgnify:CR=1 FL=1
MAWKNARGKLALKNRMEQAKAAGHAGRSRGHAARATPAVASILCPVREAGQFIRTPSSGICLLYTSPSPRD